MVKGERTLLHVSHSPPTPFFCRALLVLIARGSRQRTHSQHIFFSRAHVLRDGRSCSSSHSRGRGQEWRHACGRRRHGSGVVVAARTTHAHQPVANLLWPQQSRHALPRNSQADEAAPVVRVDPQPGGSHHPEQGGFRVHHRPLEPPNQRRHHGRKHWLAHAHEHGELFFLFILFKPLALFVACLVRYTGGKKMVRCPAVSPVHRTHTSRSLFALAFIFPRTKPSATACASSPARPSPLPPSSTPFVRVAFTRCINVQSHKTEGGVLPKISLVCDDVFLKRARSATGVDPGR